MTVRNPEVGNQSSFMLTLLTLAFNYEIFYDGKRGNFANRVLVLSK